MPALPIKQSRCHSKGTVTVHSVHIPEAGLRAPCYNDGIASHCRTKSYGHRRTTDQPITLQFGGLRYISSHHPDLDSAFTIIGLTCLSPVPRQDHTYRSLIEVQLLSQSLIVLLHLLHWQLTALVSETINTRTCRSHGRRPPAQRISLPL